MRFQSTWVYINVVAFAKVFFPIKTSVYFVNNGGRKVNYFEQQKGSLSAHQRNAIEMAFRWWADSAHRLIVGWDIGLK